MDASNSDTNPCEIRDLDMWAGSGLLPDLTILFVEAHQPFEAVVAIIKTELLSRVDH